MLADKKAANDIRNAIDNISRLSAHANKLVSDADSFVLQLQYAVNNGPAAIHSVFRDTAMVGQLNRA